MKIFMRFLRDNLSLNSNPCSLCLLTADNDQMFYWVNKDHVSGTTNDVNGRSSSIDCEWDPEVKPDDRMVYFDKCSYESMKKELNYWLSQFDNIEIVTYLGCYDFVFFAEIWGGVSAMPSQIAKQPFDLSATIAEFNGFKHRDIAANSIVDIAKWLDICPHDLCHTVVASYLDVSFMQSVYMIMWSGEEGYESPLVPHIEKSRYVF